MQPGPYLFTSRHAGMKSIYYDPARAGSYAGVEGLQKTVEEQTGLQTGNDQVPVAGSGCIHPSQNSKKNLDKSC